MKRIIIIILAILSIAITANSQSVSKIDKTASFTKKIDIIILEDGKSIDVKWPNSASITIEILSFGSAGNIVTMSLNTNGEEIIKKVFTDVDVIKYKNDKSYAYFIKDNMFNYGSLFYTEGKTVGSFYTSEVE